MGQELSKVEREVLDYLTKDFLTVKKIAHLRGTSVQAVYKILRNIKRKGFLDKGLKGFKQREVTFQPGVGGDVIRLHGQKFRLGVRGGDGYRKVCKGSNRLSVEGQEVCLFDDCVVVYGHRDFVGGDAFECHRLSMVFWRRFFNFLSSRFGFKVVGFREFGSHYASVGNGLAKKCNREGDSVKVRGGDGRVWATVDKSFRDELETVQGERSLRDMGEVVEPFFNDLRDKSPPLPSEVWEILGELARHEKELSAGLLSIVELLRPRTSEKGESEGLGVFDYVG